MKFIIDAKNDKDIAPLIEELEAIRKQSEQQMVFLTKQAKNMSEEFANRSQNVWEKIINELKSKKLIDPSIKAKDDPDFHFQLNDHDQIFQKKIEKNKHPMEELLGKLFH